MSDRRPRIIYAAKLAGRIIYIGQTLDLRKRVSEHKVSSSWYVDGVHFSQLAEVWGSDQATEVERELILEHRPANNKRYLVSHHKPQVTGTNLISVAELTAEIGCSPAQTRRYLSDAGITPAGKQGLKFVYQRTDVEPLVHRFGRRAA
jgi:predicted GIY-YIG superfamily endonuclease